MSSSLLRTNKEIIQIYNRHVNTVYQVCFMYLKNKHDTEDAVQTTFLKLMKYSRPFQDSKHEKAWLIVTASNICKNHLKYWWHKNSDIDDYVIKNNDDEDNTLELLLKLPDKYKTIIYMYYYCGYKINDIADKLNMNESTVRSYLRRGRNLLKEIIKEENNE